MQNIFCQEKIKNSVFISFNANNSNNLFSSLIEGKNFVPRLVFGNIEEEKVETSNSSNTNKGIQNHNQDQNVLEVKPRAKKSKYIRKNKKTRFRVENMNYSKSGNYLSKNSKRHENCKNKIIRNFIQDILIYWINDGIKNKNIKKINPGKIPYNFTENKNLKLKDIYKENIESNGNSNLAKDLHGDINIKLNFSLRQAFISFSNENERKNILKEIMSENEKIIEESIYDKLKTKDDYIKEKQLDLRDKMIFEDCFKNLVESL